MIQLQLPLTTPSIEQLELTARELLIALNLSDVAVRVRWSHRLTTTAGLACAKRNLILLNPRLVQFGAAEIDRTLRHELAHLIARARAGRKRIATHGGEWQQACVELGIAGEPRCHFLPLPRKQAKFFYICPACERTLPRVRPIRRTVACLDCCRKHSSGRYDARFRLKKISAKESPPALQASAAPG